MAKEKNLELDRLVFFSDAVVAIAITLLALDLKVERTADSLTWMDMLHTWPKFLAFLLSFFLIAIFWKVHHQFFALIKKIDGRMLFYNLLWLLFIVTLPFSTGVVSGYFNQTVSVFIYSLNNLLITFAQNQIWDYVAERPDYLNDKATKEQIYNNQIDCNVAMVNALIAVILSFFMPIAAFLVLFTRPVMMASAKKWYHKRNRNNEN